MDLFVIDDKNCDYKKQHLQAITDRINNKNTRDIKILKNESVAISNGNILFKHLKKSYCREYIFGAISGNYIYINGDGRSMRITDNNLSNLLMQKIYLEICFVLKRGIGMRVKFRMQNDNSHVDRLLLYINHSNIIHISDSYCMQNLPCNAVPIIHCDRSYGDGSYWNKMSNLGVEHRDRFNFINYLTDDICSIFGFKLWQSATLVPHQNARIQKK